MAKIVKRKRRRLSFVGFASIAFSCSLVLWIITSLLVNTINASLTIKIQSMSEEYETILAENKTLSYEINVLENKDRVYAIAQEANMSQIEDNIISVVGE